VMRILVYHIGSLGDTFAVVPSLKVLRENFPECHIAMLCNRPLPGAGTTPDRVLAGAGLVDRYMFYPTSRRIVSLLHLLFMVRREKFDSLCYLIRDHGGRLDRDRCFFRLCGIRRSMGAVNVNEEGLKQSEILLERLAVSGLVVGDRYDTGVVDKRIKVSCTFKCEDQALVGFGIGGKNPACKWPIERYEELGLMLIKKFDIYPVVFGGLSDSDCAERLMRAWGRGENLCGRFGIQETIQRMRSLDQFIGNDTGTIHMAASAAIRCIGIYSARNQPVLWEPHGKGHIVLRRNFQFDCSECGLEVCPRNNACIKSISVAEVIDAFKKVTN
jgi:heptosyltransferase-3